MSEFNVTLFRARSLASTTCAEKFYAILNDWDYPPEVFDETEPIRQPWENKDYFIDLWKQEAQRSFGIILTKCRRRFTYDTTVTFLFGPNRILDNKPPYHGISIYGVKESQCRGKKLDQFVGLADQLFVALDMDYGFMCLDEEYEAKNIIKNVRHEDGSLEPRHVIGMKWPYCLPGLYWVNYFGRRYLEKGFAAGIATTHPQLTAEIAGGIRLQLSDDPRFFESANATTVESEIRISLGEEWFFSREKRGNCRALDVSLDELRSPKVLD